MKPSPASTPSKPNRTEAVAVVLIPLFLLILICAVNFVPNEFHLRSPENLRLSAAESRCSNGGGGGGRSATQAPPEFRLLMGVITYAERYQARHLIRLVNSLQPPVPAQIDVRFVLCNLTNDEQRVLVGLEIMRYDDVIILNCTENMDNGKTFTYFSSVPGLFGGGGGGRPYDFVMKTDDDTYFRFPELVRSLRGQPREDLYWGHFHPLDVEVHKTPYFACGMGYALSWDVVEWISSAAELSRNTTDGHEDMTMAKLLYGGGRGKNRFSTNGKDLELRMYDAPSPQNTERFVPNTIAVHRLKDDAKWAQALRYFNVTAGVVVRPPPCRP